MRAKQLLRVVFRPAEGLVHQVPRALVASCVAGGVDFAVLVALVQGAGWNPLLAAVAGYFLGGVVQYALCALWVFPAAPESLAAGYAVFTALSLVGLGITCGVMAVCHDLAQLNYALAKVVALAAAFGWNFLSRKYWLFDRALPGAVGTSPC
jgi:putative flippase GtrA